MEFHNVDSGMCFVCREAGVNLGEHRSYTRLCRGKGRGGGEVMVGGREIRQIPRAASPVLLVTEQINAFEKQEVGCLATCPE